MFWLELAVGNDHFCKLVAAGKGGGAQKPANDSTTTCGFKKQAAETSVKFADAGSRFDFSQQ
jgi:hypothetical protein